MLSKLTFACTWSTGWFGAAAGWGMLTKALLLLAAILTTGIWPVWRIISDAQNSRQGGIVSWTKWGLDIRCSSMSNMVRVSRNVGSKERYHIMLATESNLDNKSLTCRKPSACRGLWISDQDWQEGPPKLWFWYNTQWRWLVRSPMTMFRSSLSIFMLFASLSRKRVSRLI